MKNEQIVNMAKAGKYEIIKKKQKKKQKLLKFILLKQYKNDIICLSKI